MNIERTIEQYIELRDALDVQRKAFKTTEKKYKEVMSKIAETLHAEAKKQGVESFSTNKGTAFKTTKSTVGVEEWNALVQYIKKEDMFQLLNKSVNKTAVLEHLKEMDSLPPGVKYEEWIEMQIRR